MAAPVAARPSTLQLGSPATVPLPPRSEQHAAPTAFRFPLAKPLFDVVEQAGRASKRLRQLLRPSVRSRVRRSAHHAATATDAAGVALGPGGPAYWPGRRAAIKPAKFPLTLAQDPTAWLDLQRAHNAEGWASDV